NRRAAGAARRRQRPGWGYAARPEGLPLLLPGGSLEEVVHAGPELAPAGPLPLRQLLQRLLVTDACQVGVLLPVRQGLPRLLALPGRPLDRLGPEGEVGLQPAQRLLAQPGPLLVAELAGILALACAGQGGGAGGVVAVAGPQVTGQVRLLGE